MKIRGFRSFLFLVILIIISACGNKEEDDRQDETEVPSVDNIVVKTLPTKKIYWENESLNLDGLTVTISSNEGGLQTIQYADFEKNSITTDPQNGTSLSAATNSITVVHKPSGKSASVNIVVNKAVLTLKSVDKISDTPFEKPSASIVYNGMLYVFASEGLFRFDFSSKTWETISTVEKFDNLLVRASFIHDNSWNIMYYEDSSWKLLSYDFDLKSIVKKNIGGISFSSNYVGGFFENDTLFVFDFSNYASNKKKLFGFDIANGSLKKVSDDCGMREYDQPAFFRNAVSLNKQIYFIVNISGFADIYSFKIPEKRFGFIRMGYGSQYLQSYESGVCFAYKDFLVFGLGEGADNYPQTLLFFNPKTEMQGTVKNDFYERVVGAQVFDYNGDIYLIGGTTLDAENKVNKKSRKLLERLIFE